MEAITSWTHSQRKRLSVEKGLLEQYFAGRTKWLDHTNATKAKVDIALNTNDNAEYVLRIYLTEDFPNSCPALAVVSPRLKLKDGGRFPEVHSEFHTLENVEEYPTICHFNPDSWTQEFTLYQVFMKGRLWLEAYSLYHKYGGTMDQYLKKCEDSEEPRTPENRRPRRFLDSIRRRRSR